MAMKQREGLMPPNMAVIRTPESQTLIPRERSGWGYLGKQAGQGERKGQDGEGKQGQRGSAVFKLGERLGT